jgi:hypothetical protein
MKKTGMASAATVIVLNGFKVEVLATTSGAGSWWKDTYSKNGSGSGSSVSSYATAKAEALANAQANLAAQQWSLVSRDPHTGPAQTYYVPAGGAQPTFSPSDEAFFTGTVSCQLSQVKIIIWKSP